MFLQLIEKFRGKRSGADYSDVPEWHRAIVEKVRPFTMTGVDRLLATIGAVEYVSRSKIEGDIVECGVWRGGQMMAVAMTLQKLGDERTLHLFDTFAGMTAPEAVDEDHKGVAASAVFEQAQSKSGAERWCEAGLDDVRRNVLSTGYPDQLVRFVVGPVESTLPEHAPERIAYLRLDTDWYSSTAHELRHLYPSVALHGVVAIDDYGHWQGARKATDEYLGDHGIRVLMHRIDYTGRQFVKV